MSASSNTSRIALVFASVALLATEVILFRGAVDSSREVAPANIGRGESVAEVTAPGVEITNPAERRDAESNALPAEPEPATAHGAPFTITARVKDRSDQFIERAELALLFPNRDPFSSQYDDTTGRAQTRLLAIADGEEEAREIDFMLLQPRGEPAGLWFSLPPGFEGRLVLIIHDAEADRVDYRVGDTEPIFRVDLAAIRAQFATLTIGVDAEFASDGFIVRVETDSNGIDGLSIDRSKDRGETRFVVITDEHGRATSVRRGGERRSFGPPIVLSALLPGVYRIAARSDSAAFEPAVVTLAAREERSVTLVAAPRCDVKLRVWPPVGRKLPEIGTPEIRLAALDVMFPQQNGISERLVVDGGGGRQFVEFTFRGLPPGSVVFLVATSESSASLAPGDNGVIDMRLPER
jgi:hypothetical protein